MQTSCKLLRKVRRQVEDNHVLEAQMKELVLYQGFQMSPQSSTLSQVKELVKMDNPNITLEYISGLEEEKARRRAIVFNDTLTSETTLSCEPTVSSLNNDKIDFRISFDESDDEDCTDNDDDKVDIEHFSRELSVKPLPDVINTDVGAYAHSTVYTTYSLNEYSIYMYQYGVSWGMDMAYRLPVQF
ncbi:hypothetical protein Tco_1456861 [Tanacetum coccineum]